MQKKISILLFSLILFSFFFQNTQAQRQVFKSGEVVDAEIQKAKILEWNEDKNIFVVEFDLVNNLDLTQNGVHYALELFDNSKEQGKFLVDRMVGEDLINLSPNGSVKKIIQYNFPISLEKEYELQLAVVTEKGFEFNRKTLGMISQKKAQGIFIDIIQCRSKVKNNENHIFKEIDLTGVEEFEIQCKNIKNSNSEDLIFSPKIIIKEETKFGKIIAEKKLESQILKSEEEQNFSFQVSVSKSEIKKNYVELFLVDQNNKEISNRIYFNYFFQDKKEVVNENKIVQTYDKFRKSFFTYWSVEKVGFLVSFFALIMVIVLIFRGFFKSKI